MPVEAVAAHSGAADHAADRIRLAHAAAARIRLGREAYGKICAFLPALIDPVAEAAVNALAESASALHHTATSLRGAATAAARTDGNNAHRVAGAARRLPRLPL